MKYKMTKLRDSLVTFKDAWESVDWNKVNVGFCTDGTVIHYLPNGGCENLSIDKLLIRMLLEQKIL